MDIQLGNKDNFCLPEEQQEYTEMKQNAFAKAYQSPIITAEETLIKKQLSSAEVTNECAINILIYQLANKNLLVKLLIIDRLIYKEQIDLLLFLNGKFEPQPKSALLNFYQKWFKENKEANYDFTNFLNFLLQDELIKQVNDKYSIGIMGKEYLGFLIKIGRPLFLTPAQKSQTCEKQKSDVDSKQTLSNVDETAVSS